MSVLAGNDNFTLSDLYGHMTASRRALVITPPTATTPPSSNTPPTTPHAAVVARASLVVEVGVVAAMAAAAMVEATTMVAKMEGTMEASMVAAVATTLDAMAMSRVEGVDVAASPHAKSAASMATTCYGATRGSITQSNLKPQAGLQTSPTPMKNIRVIRTGIWTRVPPTT